AVEPSPAPVGAHQLVVCRNVLIYLTDGGVKTALATMERSLAPDGWLMVGAAESLWALTDRFESVRLPGAFVYRKAGSPDSAAPAPAARKAAARSIEGLPDPADLVARGRRAAADGDYENAVTAFRQAAYLDPDQAEALAGLSVAL